MRHGCHSRGRDGRAWQQHAPIWTHGSPTDVRMWSAFLRSRVAVCSGDGSQCSSTPAAFQTVPKRGRRASGVFRVG
eukprot:1008818-Prymnesium_polylepis.2